MALTQSMTGATVRKLAVSSTGPAGLGGEALACGEERGDVGPAEPVDRLLGVADHEQAAGGHRRPRPTAVSSAVARIGGGDAHGQLDLDRVGVLELVEQQALVALVQGAPARPGPAPGRAAPGGRARAGRGTRAAGLAGAGRRRRAWWPAGRSRGGGRSRRARRGGWPPRCRTTVASWREDLVLAALATTRPCRCPCGSWGAVDRAPRGGRGRRRRPPASSRPNVDEVVDRQRGACRWGRCSRRPSVARSGQLARGACRDEVGHRAAARRTRSGTRSSTRSHDALEGQGERAQLASDRRWPRGAAGSCARGRDRRGAGRGCGSSAGRRPRRSDTSSSTSTCGGSCASTGCSDRSRCANECSVPIAAPSSWAERRAAAVGLRARRPPPPPGAARRTRSRSSAPAFSVKVMAAIGAAPPSPDVDEGDDPVDERGGLARAGARLHEQRGAEVGRDPIAGRLVGRRGDSGAA